MFEPDVIEIQNVVEVYKREGRLILVQETGKVWSYVSASQVSGISHGNVPYAMIEPKLFKYTVLNNGYLYITCPYTLPHTPTVSVYIAIVESGFIKL